MLKLLNLQKRVALWPEVVRCGQRRYPQTPQGLTPGPPWGLYPRTLDPLTAQSAGDDIHAVV